MSVSDSTAGRLDVWMPRLSVVWFLAACAPLIGYETYLMFFKPMVLRIEGEKPVALEAFGQGATVTHAFLMNGDGLRAVDVRIASDQSASVHVFCKLMRLYDTAAGADANPNLYTQIYAWSGAFSLRAGDQWHRIEFPSVGASNDRWYAFQIRVIDVVPKRGWSHRRDAEPAVSIIASEDNPRRGGKLWIGDVRQPGALFIRASGGTTYQRYRAGAAPGLPAVLWRRSIALAAVFLGIALYVGISRSDTWRLIPRNRFVPIPVHSVLVFGLAFAILGLPNLYQYLTFQFGWNDVGHVYRIVMNIFVTGTFYSLEWQMNHLAVHFTPFFYLLAAMMWPFGTMESFVMLHVAALCGIAVVVAWISALRTGSMAGMVIGAAFVVNPYTMAVNLYPHYEVFGVLFLAVSGWCLSTHRGVTALLFLLLALTVKQDFWIYGICGSLILTDRENKSTVALACLLCLTYFVVVLRIIYPMWIPHRVNRFADIWSYGATESDALRYFRDHALETWSKLWHHSGLALQLSVGLLPLGATWRFLVALPVLYLWVNATDIDRQSLAFYYALPSLYVLFLCLAFAMNRVAKLLAGLAPIGPKPLCVALATIPLVAGFVTHVELPQGLARSPTLAGVLTPAYSQSDRYLHQLIDSQIPQGRSVFTQVDVAAFLPYTTPIYVSHIHTEALIKGQITPDYILVDTARPGYPPWLPTPVDGAIDYGKGYVLRSQFEGIYLYERR